MSAEPDPVRLARALNEAGAPYLVIGGFAVIAHQYVRATEDTDLLVPADADNAAALRSAFAQLEAVVRRNGAPPTNAELTDAAHLRLDTAAGTVDLVREGVRRSTSARASRAGWGSSLTASRSLSPDCHC